MSPSTETLKDDIAYMTSLARDGSKPTYAGGEFLLMAGLIFGLGSFAAAAALGGVAGLTPAAMNIIWPVSMVAFMVCLPILIVRSRKARTYRMIGNRAVGEAWTAVGFAIFTIAISIAVMSWLLHEQNFIWLFAPIILALYGVAWSVSAALSERPWTKIMAVGSYISAVIVAALVKEPPLMFVAYGVALLLLAALPGLIWMRLHRQAQG